MRRSVTFLAHTFQVDGFDITVTWNDGAVTVDGPTVPEAKEVVDSLNVFAGDSYPYPPGVWVADAFREAASEGTFRSARSLVQAAEAFAAFSTPPTGWQVSWSRRSRPPAIWFHVAVHVPPLRSIVRGATCAPLSARTRAAEGTALEGVFPKWLVALTTPRWWLLFAGPFVAFLAFVSDRAGSLGIGFVVTALSVLCSGPIAMSAGGRLLRRAGV